jgi:hypothetical protein
VRRKRRRLVRHPNLQRAVRGAWDSMAKCGHLLVLIMNYHAALSTIWPDLAPRHFYSATILSKVWQPSDWLWLPWQLVRFAANEGLLS